MNTTLVSVQEYLDTAYSPDREYVDGQLVERHVGEHNHSRLQALITGLLLGRERERRFRSKAPAQSCPNRDSLS